MISITEASMITACPVLISCTSFIHLDECGFFTHVARTANEGIQSPESKLRHRCKTVNTHIHTVYITTSYYLSFTEISLRLYDKK